MMQFYEITIKVALCEDMLFDQTNEAIANFINSTMSKDCSLSEMHRRKGYKFYVFSSLFPIEKDKVYLSSKEYTFRIRSFDFGFISTITEKIPEMQNKYFTDIEIKNQKTFAMKGIKELYSLTPVFVTMDKDNMAIFSEMKDLDCLQKAFQANLEKKYKTFYKHELKMNSSFISSMEILNHKPISLKYKGKKLLCFKVKLGISQDIESQKLAFMAAGCVLGEKNSALGLGFCSMNSYIS